MVLLKEEKEIWDIYQSELSSVDWLTLPNIDGCTSSYYLYWLQLKNRDRFASKYMVDKGIYVTFRYYPLHLIKHYDSWDTQLPNSERINERTINIPLNQNLSDNDVEYIVKTIKEFD